VTQCGINYLANVTPHDVLCMCGWHCFHISNPQDSPTHTFA